MPRETKEWFGKNDDHIPPPSIKRRVKIRAGDCCQACGNRVRYGGQIDHVIALINGGENRETNLQFLCKTCHAGKSRVDVAKKARDHKTQIHLAGFKKPRRSFWKPSKPEKTRGEWQHYTDENGRDRLRWTMPKP